MKTLHLYFVDKNWQKRWYMENYNIIINYEGKTFKTYINPYYWYTSKNDIEVRKKSDILDYENQLEGRWFKKVSDF